MIKNILKVIMISILLISNGVMAQPMRGFDPIPTPKKATEEETKTTDIQESVPRVEMEGAVEDVAQAWSKGDVSEKISDDFDQKERFNTSMQLNVPRDTQMQVESIRGVSTLNQTIIKGPDGRKRRVSTVSATVNTRLMLNDASNGFVGVPGQNEITFEVIEELD
jgi:hypothetical protein